MGGAIDERVIRLQFPDSVLALRLLCTSAPKFWGITSAAQEKHRCASGRRKEMIKIMQVVSSMLLGAVLISGFSSMAAAETKLVPVLPGQIELTSSLRQREMAVIARERDLAAREELVKELESEIEAKLSQLTELQKDIQEKLALIKETEDINFRSLIRVYSAMKPSSVTLILNQMEDAAAVRILRAMKAEMTAQIIPRLDREKAVRVSKQLGMIE
jgi:flagellar motility protein MotE (MotC chaperone)